jgi:hypothetical protein
MGEGSTSNRTTRRGKRYFADERKRAVWDEVLARTQWAADQERQGFWITYLIRDPRYADKKGQPGLPIYVGQTKDFAHRVLTRFKTCEKEAITKGKDCVERRVADLLHLGIVAQYQVLSYQPTHLSSLVSETNMARECWNRGYDLANNGALQNGPGPHINRQQIPHEWIWDRFTIEEAAQDGVEVEVRCAACRCCLSIDVAAFKAIQLPPKDMKQIQKDGMWQDEPCVGCGVSGRRSVRLHLRDLDDG